MSQPLVLVLTTAYERSVNSVLTELDSLRVRWHRHNVELFPLAISGSCYTDLEKEVVRLTGPDGTIDSRDVTSVWSRRIPAPLIPAGLEEADRLFIQNEVRAFNSALFSALDHAKWVNPLAPERAATNKVNQLQVARACGLKVPSTVITNDESVATSFAKGMWSKGQEVLFKPVSGYSPQPSQLAREAAIGYQHHLPLAVDLPAPEPEYRIVFARKLTEQMMCSLQQLRYCPTQFQEYIPKQSEYRVTIVGEQVFTCEILSQQVEETKVDFRRFVVSGRRAMPRHKKAKLPDDQGEKLLKLVRKLGLEFGCVDMIRTPSDECVFLEINPAGQWEWIEYQTGLPITKALAEHLASQGA